VITMQHRLPFARQTRLNVRHWGERRARGAHRGVLAAVVALAFGAWMVVVQQETPELDANTARGSLAVLDDLLAADGREDR
jgi:hypothetical protein